MTDSSAPFAPQFEHGHFEVWVCAICGAQCDPDEHWGCEHHRAVRWLVRPEDLHPETGGAAC